MAGSATGAIQIDTERARAYVLAHGDLTDVARVQALTEGIAPSRELSKAIEQRQNSDGGFPTGAEAGAASAVGPSAVDATCAVLAQLKQLPPLAGSPMASRAIGYLRRAQQPDGSWRGDAWLTAEVLYILLTLEPEHEEPIRRGAQWLRKALASEEALSQQAPKTLSLVWALWSKLYGQVDAQAAVCFRRLATTALDTADLTHWLVCAGETALGGRYLCALASALADLAGRQQPDGSWASPTGSPVEATLWALWAYQGLHI